MAALNPSTGEARTAQVFLAVPRGFDTDACGSLGTCSSAWNASEGSLTFDKGAVAAYANSSAVSAAASASLLTGYGSSTPSFCGSYSSFANAVGRRLTTVALVTSGARTLASNAPIAAGMLMISSDCDDGSSHVLSPA